MHAVRWSLGIGSPNVAGSLVSAALLLLVGAYEEVPNATRGARGWLALLVGGELVLSFVLLGTRSRGGAVGLFAGFALLFALRSGSWRNRAEFSFAGRRALLLRSATWLLALPLVSLGARFARAARGDLAVVHRVELWKGGLALLASGPVWGWGRGRSGIAYINWIRPPNANWWVTGMISTYLHVGVEFGLPVLAAVVAAVTFPLLAGWQLARCPLLPADRWLGYLTAPLLAIVVENVFSTLWLFPAEWVAWAVIVGALGLAAVWRLTGRLSSGLAVVALAMGVTLASVLAAVGHIVARSSKYQIVSRGPDCTEIRTSADGRAVVVLCDGETLGTFPGEAIRATLDQSVPGWSEVRVVTGRVWNFDRDTGAIIAMGSRIREVLECPVIDARCIVLVAPSSPPPTGRGPAAQMTLLLPEFDDFHCYDRWRSWADVHHVRVSLLDGFGRDVSAAFPRIFAAALRG